ncbi:hypothetical protein COCSUDRAFT_53769 [Coccomyxa subellipsoidea C-169]|uniref:Uncharacterized protein n=1 Tax=Coccomyxa subellipsoidea (strain C-169) TaxID=574566 RepID=I0YVB8_COCSC|nr:hypothetical protein COCSUDRAFT_53769 [Coccomyxa subellipsoidea C-169]EIE22337.1 hypothetical protein COCSUDRAFT_53769 [Coccomyxa subellipsoidea C-169]|eukprot:XP_005646881.1 hypothetical protein COCSUDRAFT_53769 [Coccomyxa subellipsoidea C-169]
MTTRALLFVCCFILVASTRGETAAAGSDDSAAAKVKAAPLADIPQNGTRNGEGNGKFLVKIGGSAAFADTTGDGTGNGNTAAGSGNNNGNKATGNGNGNGNGNNNAQITIVNDPAFPSCPPCQYYDPATQLCVSVQACLNTKPAAAAVAAPPANTLSVGGAAGRKLRM